MTFIRANLLGWAPFELLLSTQMNVIDGQMPFALDGAAGGIYESTGILDYRNAVIIDGDGVTKVDPVTDSILELKSPSATSASGLQAALLIRAADNVGAGIAAAGIDVDGGDNTTGPGGLGIRVDGGNTSSGPAGPGIDVSGGFASSTGQSGTAIKADGGDGGDLGGHGIEVDGGSGDITGGHGIIATGGVAEGGTGLPGDGGQFTGGVQETAGFDAGRGIVVVGGRAEGAASDQSGVGAQITGGAGLLANAPGNAIAALGGLGVGLAGGIGAVLTGGSSDTTPGVGATITAGDTVGASSVATGAVITGSDGGGSGDGGVGLQVFAGPVVSGDGKAAIIAKGEANVSIVTGVINAVNEATSGTGSVIRAAVNSDGMDGSVISLQANDEMAHIHMVPRSGDPIGTLVNGMMWMTATELKIRVGGTTFTIDKT